MLNRKADSEVINSLIQLERDNAVVRLYYLFQERLTNPNTVILRRTRDERELFSLITARQEPPPAATASWGLVDSATNVSLD